MRVPIQQITSLIRTAMDNDYESKQSQRFGTDQVMVQRKQVFNQSISLTANDWAIYRVRIYPSGLANDNIAITNVVAHATDSSGQILYNGNDNTQLNIQQYSESATMDYDSYAVSVYAGYNQAKTISLQIYAEAICDFTANVARIA